MPWRFANDGLIAIFPNEPIVAGRIIVFSGLGDRIGRSRAAFDGGFCHWGRFGRRLDRRGRSYRRFRGTGDRFGDFREARKLEFRRLVERGFLELIDEDADVALGGCDAAAQVLVERAVFGHGFVHGAGAFGRHRGAVPEFALDAVVAFEVPGVADEVVNQDPVLRGFRLVLPVEGVDESVEILAGFAADDEGAGTETGFERILARNGLARSGARAGTFLGIEAIGLELFGSNHV